MNMKMTKKIKIAVVTGTRAEYGISKPLLVKIKNFPGFKLELIITGIHLLKQYGLTIREIKQDGFAAGNQVIMYGKNEKAGGYYGEALGQGVINFTKLFLKIKPDFLIVLGDRLEPLAATLAAANLIIPIIHIHGGEKTNSGCIDESIRHAITRFAHIHLVSTEQSRQRLIKMGEEPWRIFRVGALGQESFLNSPKIKREVLFGRFRLDSKQKLILCLFNPVIFEAEKMEKQMGEVMSAVKQLGIQSIIIYPNNDVGAEAIIKVINRHRNLPFVKIYPNLNHEDYVNLLKHADVLIGNSSSGIIEAPSINLPVVNIGLRNTGREHGDNIIFVDPGKDEIIKAIEKAVYDEKFRRKLRQGKNPYGDPKTAEKIVNILNKIKIGKKLLIKRLTH